MSIKSRRMSPRRVSGRGTLPWSWIVDDVIDDRDRFDWLTIYDWRSINHDRDRQTFTIDDRHNLMIDDWWRIRWKTHKSLFVTFLQKHQKDLLSVAVKTQKCHFFFEHHIFSAIFHKSIGKDVERRKKSSNYCVHCLRAKLRFWELRASFLRIQLIDNKQ